MNDFIISHIDNVTNRLYCIFNMSNDINFDIANVISALNNKYDNDKGVQTAATSEEAKETAQAATQAAQAAQTAATAANNVAVAASTLINTALPQKADKDDVLLNTGGSVNGNVTVNGNLSVTGTINATIQGTTSNATKAIQDGDGNVITSTYLKKTENAVSATTSTKIVAKNIPDGNYTDVVQVTSGDTSGENRIATIRAQNNDGSNSIVIGAHDESNSAPAGLTITNTNGTLTSTLPGTFTANTFKGSLVGNADTATNATQAELAAKATADASGNTITSTYATKTELTNGLSGKANSEHGTHVTFTTTTPNANGTAAVGSATTVSRSDHVHPLQTTVSGSSGSCTGNAATATKLAAAKTIAISGGATGTATSFDGSSNITIPVTALDMSKASTGTLAVARGGTGLTASPSMLVNLASTTAANVLAASPRPGVTGVLPVANGGTGSSTKNFVDLSSAQTIAGTKTFSSIVINKLDVANNYYHKGCGTNYSPSADTTAVWADKQPGHYWYSTNSILTDQPSQYGHLLNLGQSTEVFQLWCCAPSGPLYYRSGNANGGWNNTTWKCLDGKASITTTYSNGANWYRVYSDGWIEQGGLSPYANDATTTVTLHKTFSNTDYTVTVCPIATVAMPHTRVASKTTSSFVIGHWVKETSQNYQSMWYACGY